MGFSVRDASFRLTVWKKWDGASLRPIWDVTAGVELYDHRGDDGTDFDAYENENIANHTEVQADVERLEAALRARFSA